MSETVIVGDGVRTRIGERDQEFSQLFDEHYSSLRGLAYVMLGDAGRAEEVVMDAFIKVFSIWGRFRSVERKGAYLRKVVVNLCRARIRRERIEHRVNALTARVSRSELGGSPELHSDAVSLWGAVAELPERQRACIVLRYLEDLPDAEIAETLDCSIGTVKSQLSKARAKLASALDESYPGRIRT